MIQRATVTQASPLRVRVDGATTSTAAQGSAALGARVFVEQVGTTVLVVGGDTAALQKAANLSDLADVATARANLVVNRVTEVVVTVDLPSIAANTTVTVDIALPAGSLLVGDQAFGWRNAAPLPHGLHLAQLVGRAGDDTLRTRWANLTAAAIDLASTTFVFFIRRVG